MARADSSRDGACGGGPLLRARRHQRRAARLTALDARKQIDEKSAETSARGNDPRDNDGRISEGGGRATASKSRSGSVSYFFPSYEYTRRRHGLARRSSCRASTKRGGAALAAEV